MKKKNSIELLCFQSTYFYNYFLIMASGAGFPFKVVFK